MQEPRARSTHRGSSVVTLVVTMAVRTRVDLRPTVLSRPGSDGRRPFASGYRQRTVSAMR